MLPEVGECPGHADLCRRCAEVVDRAGLSPLRPTGNAGARTASRRFVVAILDQLSKAAVLAFFAERALGDRETVTSFFNLALTYNRGISFGLFNGGAGLNALVFSSLAAGDRRGLDLSG